MFTKKRRAFSIVEMIITLSIFSIISAISMSVLYNANRSAKAIQTQIFLYTESQALMDQIARVVERNSVDYEAYYSKLISKEESWNSTEYGQYGQRFVDPGSGGPEYDGYGTYCAGSKDTYPDDCSFPDFESIDTRVGQNPYDGTAVEESNAFCEEDTKCGNLEKQILDYLILINEKGDERVIFRQKSFGESSDFYLSKMEMQAIDSDGDGIEDEWTCSTKYSCTEAKPEEDDFKPISPSAINIESFKIIISPPDDPYRAFAESDMQVQPQVTIIMRVTLSENYGSKIIGTPPSLTFQRTVSTGIYSEIRSYE